MPVAGLRLPATGHVVVVVGPEGGISPEELEAFAGVVPVRLGVRGAAHLHRGGGRPRCADGAHGPVGRRAAGVTYRTVSSLVSVVAPKPSPSDISPVEATNV